MHGKLLDRLILRCVGVDDQSAERREKLCKFPEGMADVIDVLEEIQMIGIHVQDHTDLREKLKKLLVYSHASVIKVSEFPTDVSVR